MPRPSADMIRLRGPKGEDVVAPLLKREYAYQGDSTSTITLSSTPTEGMPIMLSLSGFVQTEGVDFTVSGRIITLATPTSDFNWQVFYYGD